MRLRLTQGDFSHVDRCRANRPRRPGHGRIDRQLATGLLIVSAAFLIQLAIHVAVVVPEAEAAWHEFLP